MSIFLWLKVIIVKIILKCHGLQKEYCAQFTHEIDSIKHLFAIPLFSIKTNNDDVLNVSDISSKKLWILRLGFVVDRVSYIG